MPRTWRFYKVFCLFLGPRYHPYQFLNWPLYSWAGEGKAEKVGGSRDYRFAWSPSFGKNFFFSNVYVPSLHYLLKWGVGTKVAVHEGGKVERSNATPINFFFYLWAHFWKILVKFWWEWHHSFLLSRLLEMVTFGPTPHFIALLGNRLNFLQICTIFVLQCCFLYIFVASTYLVLPRLIVSTFQQNFEFQKL